MLGNTNMFVIEDGIHSDWHGEFSNLEEALSELRRRANIKWGVEPNQAPCSSWKTCGREYWIIEFESDLESKEIRRFKALEISASGVKWEKDIQSVAS